MITVTRLNNSALVINPDLIVSIEKTPDTIITLSNGEKITVQEEVILRGENSNPRKTKRGLQEISWPKKRRGEKTSTTTWIDGWSLTPTSSPSCSPFL